MAENSGVRLTSRLRRGAVACQRCRRRKQRCDLAYPQCSSCKVVQAECLSYHSGKQREVPRDYTESLETEVERLKRELEASKAQLEAQGGSTASPIALSASHSSPQNSQDLIKSLAMVVMEPSEEPRMLGTSSGLTLAKAVLASVGCNLPKADSHGRTYNDELRPPDLISSLPPEETAVKLVDVYFQCRTPHLPLFDRETVLDFVRNAYEAHDGNIAALSSSVRRDLFATFMVFAISLCGIQDGSGGRSAQSEGCFHSALQYLDTITANLVNDTETLGNILLLAQYVSLTPSKGSLWLLTGLALRISINLCLHWETEVSLSAPESTLTQRRRLWWATYWFDRQLAITIGRPMGIDEQSVGAEFPMPSSSSSELSTDRHAQLAANHLVRLAQLETEIKHVVYRQKIKYSLAFPRPNYSLWLAEFEPRLREWKTLIPDVRDAHPGSIYSCKNWWDAMYYNALVLLYRPSPLVPSPSDEQLQLCFDASKRVIECTQALQRGQKLEMYWAWVQRLFVAGLTFVYSVWNSDKLRSIEHAQDIINTAQTCSTTLAVLAEKVPSAAGCRDTIQSLVTATVNGLLASFRKTSIGPKLDVSSLAQPCLTDASGQQYAIQQYMQDMYYTLFEDVSGMGQNFDPTAGMTVTMDSPTFYFNQFAGHSSGGGRVDDNQIGTGLSDRSSSNNSSNFFQNKMY